MKTSRRGLFKMFAVSPVAAILAKHVPEEVTEEDGTGWIEGGYVGSSFSCTMSICPVVKLEDIKRG